LLELYWFPLRRNVTHRAIVELIDELRNKGVSLSSAVKRVLGKHKSDFGDLFEVELSDDENSEYSDSKEEDVVE
jgi:hypothetical protein